MASVFLTLIQANPTSGHLESNLEHIRALWQALPAVQGPQLVVIPTGAIEGQNGREALTWPMARSLYERTIDAVGSLAQGTTAVVLPYIDKEGNQKVVFFHRGEKTMLPTHGLVEWGGVSFSLDEETPADAQLYFRRFSTVGHRFQGFGKGKLHFFCAVAGGDGLKISAGDTGFYGPEGADVLPPWESGAIRFALERGGDLVLQVTRAAATPRQYPSVSADARYEALRAGIRDYVTKNRIRGVVIGLSGGVDSALVASLAVDALGAAAVKGILLPSRFTSTLSLTCAAELAKNLGIATETLSIEPLFEASLATLRPLFGEAAWDLTEENLQARARAILLMAVANKEGRLLLCTSNKAEAAMGYGTLYGDITGGYAPLIDLWKGDVYALCESRNAAAGFDVIPRSIIERAPSAELHEGQLDSDSLPPYDEIEAVVTALLHKSPMTDVIATYGEAKVRDIVHRYFVNAYKRAQGIPGPAVSDAPLSVTSDWGLGGDWLARA